MEEVTKKEIGQRINTLLAEQDKKQKELAEALGVLDNTISYFVSGKRVPNLEQITKIAQFFDVSTDYLLGRTGAKTQDMRIRDSRKSKQKNKKPETLGERLGELREAAGLNQDELADRLSLSRGAVSFYETDARIPNAGTLVKYARIFNTTTDYLTGLSKARTTDINIKAVCDYTGLCEQTVHDLHTISFLNTAKDAETNRLINALIKTCIEEVAK